MITYVPILKLNELTVESFNLDTKITGYDSKAVVGDFATEISQRLNELFAKDRTDAENSMGLDMGDEDSPEQPQGPKDIVGGIASMYPTINNSVSLECKHIGTLNVELTNECNRVNTVFITSSLDTVNQVIEQTRNFLENGKRIVLILVADNDTNIMTLKVEQPVLVDLLNQYPDNFVIYFTYLI